MTQTPLKISTHPRRRRQKGFSPIGWLLVILVGGFFLLVAFKVTPPYFDNMYIADALRTLPELGGGEYGYDNVTKTQVTSHLQKYFAVNNVRGEVVKNIEVTRDKRNLIVDINYEVRVPFAYNVDVVMTFKNQFDSSRPDECCKPKSE